MRKSLVFIIYIITINCLLCQQKKLPKFEEMENFSRDTLQLFRKKKTSKRTNTKVSEKFSIRKQFRKLFRQEEKEIRKQTYSFQKNNEGFRLVDHYIQVGLFHDALQYLRTFRRKAVPTYHYYESYLLKWLGKEQESDQALVKADNLMKRRRDPLYRAVKIQQICKKKFLQWRRFYHEFKKHEQKVQKNPREIRNWQRLAEYANILEYRIEEIVILKVMNELFPKCRQKNYKRLRILYRETGQKAKAKKVGK